jgi:hypothetical protein
VRSGLGKASTGHRPRGRVLPASSCVHSNLIAFEVLDTDDGKVRDVAGATLYIISYLYKNYHTLLLVMYQCLLQ